MYELELDSLNIKKTLISGSHGRNGSLWKFFQFIYNINTRCTISIDGDWGTGKTFL